MTDSWSRLPISNNASLRSVSHCARSSLHFFSHSSIWDERRFNCNTFKLYKEIYSYSSVSFIFRWWSPAMTNSNHTIYHQILLFTIINKKSPQILGLGPMLCWQILWPANFNVNPLNILVHLQLLWLRNAYQFKVLFHLQQFGRNLRRVLGTPIYGLWEC